MRDVGKENDVYPAYAHAVSGMPYGICTNLVSWWAVGLELNGDYKRLGDSYNPSMAQLQVYPWTNSHVLLRPASRRGSMGIGNEE